LFKRGGLKFGVGEHRTPLLIQIWGSVYVANPFPSGMKSGIGGKFQLEWEKKGVVKRIGANRYVRNPFCPNLGSG